MSKNLIIYYSRKDENYVNGRIELSHLHRGARAEFDSNSRPKLKNCLNSIAEDDA